MKRNIIPALFISLALHALLAVALAFYLNDASAPDELAELDLTSVDLSFSETVGETSATMASAPSSPSDASPPVEAPAPAEAASSPPPGGAVSAPRPAEAAFSPPQMEPKLPAPGEPIEKVAIEPERKVGGHAARVDAPPKPCRSIRPDYPPESRRRGEHGVVTLELDVAADGAVSAVRVLKSSGYPLLDAAAVRTARTAGFTPAKSGGEPVAATVRLPLVFRLK